MKPLWLCLICGTLLQAQTSEPWQPIPRRLPPQGIEVPQEVRRQLSSRLEALAKRADQLHGQPEWADVEVFLKAVRFALDHGEFYNPREFGWATQLLDEAESRIGDFKGKHWASKSGNLVRGYVSAIDGSVQPYGLVIPPDLDRDKSIPLYVWLHGRGDKKTDLHFIRERMTQTGRIAPQDAIVVHPFGRQCVGFKSAGEIDVLDVVDQVCKKYPIDRNRIILMGFSMGGAGAWHLGAHYSDRWAAVAPGAGFAETAEYNRLSADQYPAWHEMRLWDLYDVPEYVRNLFDVPVVAYSGEKDRQIQAARIMEAAFEQHGQKLNHIIGPGMGHKYHPDSLKQIMAHMAEAAKQGRDPDPKAITFQTRTLRYPSKAWVHIDGLDAHWNDCRVDLVRRDDFCEIRTQSVTRLRLTPSGRIPTIVIDGFELDVNQQPQNGILLTCDPNWKIVEEYPKGLRKRPRQQGPIDDAFMDPFLVVEPTGKHWHSTTKRWVDFELEHFVSRWRGVMRGDVRRKKDVDVTAEDLQKFHVILWGDPSSNQILKRVINSNKLPMTWTRDELVINATTYDTPHVVPLMIYPNPLQTDKYVVINSGLTFREDHDRTNSLQNPKLPDWAVIDIRTPPSGSAPGRVMDADFFNEYWQIEIIP